MKPNTAQIHTNKQGTNKIDKYVVRQYAFDRMEDLALKVGVSHKAANTLIREGDRGLTYTMHGARFAALIQWYMNQGFSRDLALAAARFGVGAKNDRCPANYYLYIDGELFAAE